MFVSEVCSLLGDSLLQDACISLRSAAHLVLLPRRDSDLSSNACVQLFFIPHFRRFVLIPKIRVEHGEHGEGDLLLLFNLRDMVLRLKEYIPSFLQKIERVEEEKVFF